ncbi:MAG TPA: response regulator [Armatimonadota bacterium]|nr:response regulator [Armatimonadota bacterium]
MSALGTDEAMILLVDDDEAMRELFCKLLACHGYTAVPAANAAQAFTMLSALRFHLVISDHTMPDGTGAQLIRHVRARYPWTRTMLISCDIYHLPQLAQQCGADTYYEKGDAMATFMHAVRELLGGQ